MSDEINPGDRVSILVPGEGVVFGVVQEVDPGRSSFLIRFDLGEESWWDDRWVLKEGNDGT